MPAHLATDPRARRGAYLAIAVGVGLIGFTIIDEDPRPDGVRIDATSGTDDATEPTVLGAVITRGDTDATAPPAAPATFEITVTGRGTTSTTRATQTTTTTRATSTSVTLGTPWSTERDPDEVTTTTSETTSTTVEVTTTTEDTTTTSAVEDPPTEP
jgi:hypothetical protein